MRHVVEVVRPLAHPGRAPEIVDRDRRDPALRKPQRKLLVEPVEAADVREDDDAAPGRLLGRRREGGKAVAVGRFEDEILVADCAALDRRHGRQRVELEAHGATLSPPVLRRPEP